MDASRLIISYRVCGMLGVVSESSHTVSHTALRALRGVEYLTGREYWTMDHGRLLMIQRGSLIATSGRKF